jgi:hypothetical protein
MMVINHGEKIFFGAVCALALWVGVFGYFLPSSVDRAIPWLVPPLHARFLGSMYLSGAAFNIAGMLARTNNEVRILRPAIAVWTGMLCIISLFYLPEFDFARVQTWIWFAAYIAYPLIALWLAWGDRSALPTARFEVPRWASRYLLAQGAIVGLLALSLLFAPAQMAVLWPWKITRMLAQMYAAPFLSYSFISVMLSRKTAWADVWIGLLGSTVFALGVLLASFIHQMLFMPPGPAAVLWFGGFALATVVTGTLCLRAARARFVRQM